MNCQDTRKFIHSYLDGELDLSRSLEVEDHLQDCPVCFKTYQNYRALQTALGDRSLHYQASSSLRKRVQASVHQADRAASAQRRLPWRWIGVAAAASEVVLVLVAGGLIRGLTVPVANDFLIQELIDSHVRSLMPDHLADVSSTDQHTVKPWFNGKVDYSPEVVDLAAQGYPLVGGRLDFLDNRPVAALVYKRQQHVINLFVWPTTSASNLNTTTETRQGFHVVHWDQGGMTYWAVSDLNQVELQDFVRLVQLQSGP